MFVPLKAAFDGRLRLQHRLPKKGGLTKRQQARIPFWYPDLIALDPCPYAFHFDWTDADGKSHKSTCDDWETAATFYRFEKTLGAKGALHEMGQIFNERYPAEGMVFAMGTHSRYPDSWLLVGVLRLDRVSQLDLF